MDLKGYNIVIFSLFRFDAEIESTSFAIAKQLSVHNKVYYFDNPYTLNDVVNKRKTDAYKRRRGLFSMFSDKSIRTQFDQLEVFILPIVLSIHFLPEGKIYRLLLKLNEYLIKNKIRNVLNKRGVADFIYINSFNFHYPTISDTLHPALTVYQCLDPIQGDFDARHGADSEKIIVENSDLIICSSKQLYTEKLALNPDTCFIPNAADLEHSQKALNPDLMVSPLLSGISKPLIGYLGSIDHRMDFSLLERVATQHSDKSFTLIGPMHCTLPDAIKRLPNIYFLGKITYDQMPAVVKGFDVCIIPFVKDEKSATVFPLKLFEYLGVGKPVVSSDFNPDLEDFTLGTVSFCKNPSEFADAIQDVLDHDTIELRDKRIEVASHNTWKHRSDAILQLISGYLGKKLPR